MSEERHPTPAEEVKRLYDESEVKTAKAFEQLVSRDSFGELLAKMTENVVALTKIGTDVFDLVLRNLRLAGRQDINRLARQLARSEDKLELLLQEVERLRDEQQGSGRSGRSSRSSGANGARTGRAKRSRGSGGGST